ncbi:hypothetical protein TRVL_08803 [Trypanosoma vivax]|nr:hypothetical protein TRVL_08803 [Trypanosoma vivax]
MCCTASAHLHTQLFAYFTVVWLVVSDVNYLARTFGCAECGLPMCSPRALFPPHYYFAVLLDKKYAADRPMRTSARAVRLLIFCLFLFTLFKGGAFPLSGCVSFTCSAVRHELVALRIFVATPWCAALPFSSHSLVHFCGVLDASFSPHNSPCVYSKNGRKSRGKM